MGSRGSKYVGGSDALPLFSTALADTGGSGLALEGKLIMGQNDQGGTVRSAIENRQTVGGRDTTSAGQGETPRTTPSAATARRGGNVYTYCSCEGEGEPAARGRPGRPRGSCREP